MTEELPSILMLSAMAIAALCLTIARGGVSADAASVQSAVRFAAIATVAQAGHFAEELVTGFDARLPAAFGLSPMSRWQFVGFNVAWLGIWAMSARELQRRRHRALFPLWFLGIGGVANGVAHPLLAVNDGGYFPGLATSPLVAVFGASLLVRLSRVTTWGTRKGL